VSHVTRAGGLVVLLLLGSAGYLACLVPAWRAGKADPVAVLRE